MVLVFICIHLHDRLPYLNLIHVVLHQVFLIGTFEFLRQRPVQESEARRVIAVKLNWHYTGAEMPVQSLAVVQFFFPILPTLTSRRRY